MGMPEGIVRRVLGLVGHEVNGHEFDEEASTLTWFTSTEHHGTARKQLEDAIRWTLTIACPRNRGRPGW